MLRAELELDSPLALHVELAVAPGRCLALTGPSGAGKTTTLRALAGLTAVRHGRVVAGDQVWLDTAGGRCLAAERRRVGMVFQGLALFEHMSAWRNVAYGMSDRPRREREPEARALLAGLGVGERADARPRELSGGQRQRVALARALARRPSALLLDEPLSSLDARTRAAAARELATTLRATAAPTVLVTHDFAEAAQLADEVAVLDGGRVVQRGTPSELASAPATGFVADFTGAVVIAGVAAGRRVRLEGGGEIATADDASGDVAVTLHPWDVVLDDPAAPPSGSARNRLPSRVATVTRVGSRVRVGLDGPPALVAEVTPEAADALALAPGREVVAVFKASAVRVVRA